MSAYKTIVVHLDDQPRSGVRVEVAAAWAREFGAHLVGLSPTGVLNMPGQVGPALGGAANYIQLSLEFLEERARQIADRFEQQATTLELPSHEVHVPKADPVPATVAAARAADLVVVGQSDPDVKAGPVPRDFPELVVLQAGCPVLVVPYTGTSRRVASRVLVAWHPGRESARALRDALPALQRATQVHLVHFTSSAADSQVLRQPLEDTTRWLLRHGVSAQGAIDVVGIDFGNALLSRASDVDADLIVMGGYGHSRLREFVLGGVTRRVLSDMTVPVLMSH